MNERIQLTNNLKLTDKKPARGRLLSFVLALCLLVITLASCDAVGSEAPEVHDYGTYGMQMAFRLSNQNPFREAYSSNERATGDLIIKELETLGYEPEIQAFTHTTEEGEVKSSRNIIVRIEGEGFYLEEDVENYNMRAPVVTGQTESSTKALPELHDKQVIIGTHYDSPTTQESREIMANYSGISDNSSGIAALLTLAQVLRDEEHAYDIVLVFFGAGNDEQRGAKAFLNEMSFADVRRTDCVYTIQNIYAGDKLYAHAGRSSLLPGRKYDMRRKLYEATDVVLEHNLRGTMGVDLVMNQGGYMVEVPGFEGRHVYREFSLQEGDYLPFDERGIPVVFMEAAEYDVDRLADVTESEHPAFEASGGIVSGTDFDNTYTLRVSLGTEILQNRINASAFILLKAIQKGSFSYVPVSSVEFE